MWPHRSWVFCPRTVASGNRPGLQGPGTLLSGLCRYPRLPFQNRQHPLCFLSLFPFKISWFINSLTEGAEGFPIRIAWFSGDSPGNGSKETHGGLDPAVISQQFKPSLFELFCKHECAPEMHLSFLAGTPNPPQNPGVYLDAGTMSIIKMVLGCCAEGWCVTSHTASQFNPYRDPLTGKGAELGQPLSWQRQNVN